MKDENDNITKGNAVAILIGLGLLILIVLLWTVL